MLDFIAFFANWDLNARAELLTAARALTSAAHVALGGESGTTPVVVDPFAGGGAIPLEALRVGAEAYASDLNPVAILLNKVVLEYVPTYGVRLSDEVEKWGNRVAAAVQKELEQFYPKGPDKRTPLAYLWARTARCEGPDCGAVVPMIRSLLLAKKGDRSVGLKLVVSRGSKTVRVEVVTGVRAKELQPGTVKRGALMCPACGYTTKADRVRKQYEGRRGGTRDALLLAVVTDGPNGERRAYRMPVQTDLDGIKRAKTYLEEEQARHTGPLSLVPDEPLPYLRSIFNIWLLDTRRWGDLFADRPALALAVFGKHIREAHRHLEAEGDRPFADAVATVLAFVPNRCADFWSSLARWIPGGEKIGQTFGRQALGTIWDYAEGSPFADISGSFERCLGYLLDALRLLASAKMSVGHAERASATAHPLPDDSAQVVFTDPPYYDAVPYADLSDFFYVWFRRNLRDVHPGLFVEPLAPKREEIVQLAERNKDYAYKTKERFETLMCDALAEARRVIVRDGVAVVVFAHKSTAAWETMLQAVLQAGWCVTASWPIDTEKPGRLRAQKSAALASSIHLVCRPREDEGKSVGEWREILAELPRRIHDWMPRLAEEGVVGADAIFACLGPALEVFSRYSKVEKVSGDAVQLREYLEQVWAEVSREALAMIFADADTTGLEPDARLTAMWLWTLVAATDTNGSGDSDDDGEDDADDDDDEDGERVPPRAGLKLDYDTARKIAQGLGARLEELSGVVEVRGDAAILLPVVDRAGALFGKAGKAAAPVRKKKNSKQAGLFGELDEVAASEGWEDGATPLAAKTTLDRLHQAMLLFASSRGEALRRFVVEAGVGKDNRFWALAQALSALYPAGIDEKRWVDGVLARKRGLGF